MIIFYDIVKMIFFFLTLLVGVFYLRGQNIVTGQVYHEIYTLLMPGYLLFCGLMIGYLIANIWDNTKNRTTSVTSIYIKSFIIGIVIGLALSFGYMYI